MPPSAFGPNKKPIITGDKTARVPGPIIFRNAALVAMSTHLAVSGFALPSNKPGISLNCLLTSLIISKAASPTAVIVIELTKKGKIPPKNIPHKTNGSLIAKTKLSSLLEIFSI